jgi:hypothetical protein
VLPFGYEEPFSKAQRQADAGGIFCGLARVGFLGGLQYRQFWYSLLGGGPGLPVSATLLVGSSSSSMVRKSGIIMFAAGTSH